MKIFGFNISRTKEEVPVHQPKSSVAYQESEMTFGHNYAVISKKWDGEKTLGELGVVVKNVPDYQKLRLRSYHAYATIDTFKSIASKFFFRVIGSGLKLQTEPNRTVLESEGIFNTKEEYALFQKNVEARFSVYANSKKGDYLGEKNIHEIAWDFYQGQFLGGDNLCVIRFTDDGPNAQFISGEHIQTPDLDKVAEAEAKGNVIRHGIEVDKFGKHVAYWVSIKKKDTFNEFERISAVGDKSKKRLAWMISGEKISPDHVRSVPEMSQSLEKINKLDRYIEAAVTKAEQGAKLVYAIEHEEFSTGESPTDRIVAQKRGDIISSPDVATNQELADGLANRITQTSSGMAYNLTPGAKMKSFESSIETNFSEFADNIFNSVSSGVNLPPEIAKEMFNSNYTAAKAALNSFDYTNAIIRTRFSNVFYKPFYELWLEHQILTKKIVAKGYIENIDNFMVTESYNQCRFTARNMPHVDPLKEIKAIRSMLGDKTKGEVTLISNEQATEMLGAGQWDENFMKSLEEKAIIPKEEIIKTNQNTNQNENKGTVTK